MEVDSSTCGPFVNGDQELENDLSKSSRPIFNENELCNLNHDEIVELCKNMNSYMNSIERKNSSLEARCKEIDDQTKCIRDPSYREKVLIRRLTARDRELQEAIDQLNNMKAAHAPSSVRLKSSLMDPAVNLLVEHLRKDLVATKATLEETQNELNAWKFTPDSNTGKRLMTKCRLLQQENEELGKIISSGRVSKLEGELALQKSLCEEVKKSQCELDDLLQDLDEDVEGMQGTMYYLQLELKKSNEVIVDLKRRNRNLRAKFKQFTKSQIKKLKESKEKTGVPDDQHKTCEMGTDDKSKSPFIIDYISGDSDEDDDDHVQSKIENAGDLEDGVQVVFEDKYNDHKRSYEGNVTDDERRATKKPKIDACDTLKIEDVADLSSSVSEEIQELQCVSTVETKITGTDLLVDESDVQSLSSDVPVDLQTEHHALDLIDDLMNKSPQSDPVSLKHNADSTQSIDELDDE